MNSTRPHISRPANTIYLLAMASLLFAAMPIIDASEKDAESRIVETILCDTGQYYNAEQFVKLYGITNIYFPSKHVSVWTLDATVRTEISCGQLVRLAASTRERMQREAKNHKDDSLASKLQEFELKLKRAEKTYWEKRHSLAQELLKELSEALDFETPDATRTLRLTNTMQNAGSTTSQPPPPKKQAPQPPK